MKTHTKRIAAGIVAVLLILAMLLAADAIYGDPDTGWSFDPARLEALILSIERADCDTCIASHNSPHSKASMLRLLRRKLESL